MHVVVAVRQKRVAERFEDSGFIATEMIGEDQVQRGAGFWLVLVMPMRVVPAAAIGYLLRRQSEEEKVLFARLSRHLNGRAVAGADRQSPIHHELHVAGTAGLKAGGRNLVTDIAGWNQPLGE